MLQAREEWLVKSVPMTIHLNIQMMGTFGNVNVDKCEIRNAADLMSDCSERNCPLAYLDNRVGKPPTDWLKRGRCQSMDSDQECQSCVELDRVQDKMNNIDQKEVCI